MPKVAAGIVPTTISGTSLPCSVLKSRRARSESIFSMSLLKNSKTTISVPTCRVNSKSKEFSGVRKLRKCSATFKCPVLDMGSHSVKP